MSANDRELFFQIGREEGIKEEALEGIWSVHQKLADIGILGTMKDEATVRASFQRFKDKLNNELDFSKGFDIGLIGAGVLIDALEKLAKGGDENNGKGIGIQGFGRVQGSC